MTTGAYRFNVGKIECVCVSDGSFAYAHPMPVLFTNAPEAEREQAVRKYGLDPHTWTEFLSPYTCLLINTDGRYILVDTGAGSLGPSTGQLAANLQAAGVTPEQIDTVVLTHAHADHVGGNLDAEGKIAFPNARWVMSKVEWNFWMGEATDLSLTALPDEMKGFLISFARRSLAPLQGIVELISQETEIAPGVRIFPAPGHTPGHMALTIASEGERLLHLVDVVIHPIQIENPEWYAAFDTLPELTVATRLHLLERVVTEKDRVLHFHFPPFPGVGHIVKSGEVWQWQPVQ